MQFHYFQINSNIHLLICQFNNCQYFYFHLDEIESPNLKPGIRFTERMKGHVTLEKTGELSDLEFTVTIEAQDVEFMLQDSKHEAVVIGNVKCLGLSPDPMAIESGIN